MSKKPKTADLPLPEELLDKYIGFLEGPVNGVFEKLLKSKIVLAPLGLSQAIVWKSLGLVLGRTSTKPSRKQER